MVEAKKTQEQQDAEPLSYSGETILDQLKGSAHTNLDLSVEDQLALSKASRNHAEGERQRIASGILDATRQACQELISDGEKVLKKAKRLEAEAERKEQTAQGVLERANTVRADANAYSEKSKREADTIRAEADAHAERVMAEAQQQAQDIIEHARTAAHRECVELKQQASFEAKQMLSQAQVIRAAAQEELEAHRIYAEAARLNAESHEVLVYARTRLEDPLEDSPEEPLRGSPRESLRESRNESPSETNAAPEAAGSSERHAVLELTECWKGVDDAEDYDTIADELEAMKDIAAKAAQLAVEPEDTNGNRKSGRKAKPASE